LQEKILINFLIPIITNIIARKNFNKLSYTYNYKYVCKYACTSEDFPGARSASQENHERGVQSPRL